MVNSGLKGFISIMWLCALRLDFLQVYDPPSILILIAILTDKKQLQL